MEKKIALITGASRGIGRAVAVALAGAGCHVLINFRNRQTAAEETLGLVQQNGGSGELIPFDVAESAACEEAIKGLLKTHQRIDILVNNAGLRNDSLLVFMKPEQWTEVISTNLNSFYNVTRPVVTQMALNR
jgi:3-oxoacyl-[acyl-carrier protein] reductase